MHTLGFEGLWSAVSSPRDGEAVSPELRPLLERAYFDTSARPANTARIKESLENLLGFLATNGRTNANCWAVDLFFGGTWQWESEWSEEGLPDVIHDVLADMGQALHDTVKDPEIASNFESLPEQLFERIRKFHP